MRNIIILYDLIAREYWGCNKLKIVLKKKGCNVNLYQWNFEYYKAILHALANKPDVLIIPSCYTDKIYKRVVMPFKIISKGIKVICMHNEQIGYYGLEEDYLIPSEPLCKNTMYHVSWGEYYESDLIKHGIKKSLIKKVGSIRLQESLAKTEKITKDDLAKEYNLDINKKWIIYCDGGGALFYNMAQKRQSASKVIGGTKELDEMVDSYGESYIKTIEILNEFIEKNYNQYELIFRLHPGLIDIDSEMFNEKIKIVRNHTVYTWFRYAYANVVFQSTSILESDAMGIKSIVLRPFKLKYEVAGVKDYPTCENLEELKELLVKANSNTDSSRIYTKYLGDAKNDVVELLSEEIISILKSDNNIAENVESKTNFKKLFTSLIANLTFNVFCLAGVLNSVKWPLTFAMNKYEHPYFKDKYI